MSTMIPYPKKATTPNRKARKSERSKVFATNKKASKLRREARKEARNGATSEE